MAGLANISNFNGDISRGLGTAAYSSEARNFLRSGLSGIEARPYQFMDTVDRRIEGTEIGRKYADRIVSRMPLLFLTPANPLFMYGFSDEDRSTMAAGLAGESVSGDLIGGNGRYYSLNYAYPEYYKYVQTALSAVVAYLGINNEQITINGRKSSLISYPWSEENNSNLGTFFDASENVVFYLDRLVQVQESFQNDTGESSLASQINGLSDTANEIKFLFGNNGSLMESISEGLTEATSSITSSLSGIIGKLGGGIIGSLADKGLDTVVNGGKIIFPKIWTNSSSDKSYSLDLKLRSPDHDNLSIFLNIIKPYVKILCLALPKMMKNQNNESYANGYMAPFMVKAFSKGMFSIEYGMITSLSVSKGDECCWNDDGLPTQIDISIQIEDLYNSLAMSSIEENSILTTVANTAYMDFLANMSGLNVAQMEIGRRIKFWGYLAETYIDTWGSRKFTEFDRTVSNLMGSLYKKLS